MILLWVASQAVKQNSRTIRFRWGADILRDFGLPPDGAHYRNLEAGFKRVFGSTIFFGTDEQSGSAQAWESTRVCFFDRLELWNINSEKQQLDGARYNELVLSEAFWHEVKSHPIPLDQNIVTALTHAPGTLDFYMWVSWRSYRLNRIARVPLFGSNGLSAQLGSRGYGRKRDFRRTLTRWIDDVKQLWPDCPVCLSRDGDQLIVGRRPDSQAAVNI